MEKEYTIDGKPVTWKELINTANEYGEFRDTHFKTTSEAAGILRDNGFIVDINHQ